MNAARKLGVDTKIHCDKVSGEFRVLFFLMLS